MSYTIKLEGGKYLVVNDNGSLTILRHGEPWPAAEELKHVKLVGALAARVQELEETIRAVVDGELNDRGVRGCMELGLRHWRATGAPPDAVWHFDDRLRNVLEQK